MPLDRLAGSELRSAPVVRWLHCPILATCACTHMTIDPPPRPATFFCKLEYIEVNGAIGPKAEFDEDFFLTNDRSTIEKLLDWRYSNRIGTLEFHHFLKSPLVA